MEKEVTEFHIRSLFPSCILRTLVNSAVHHAGQFLGSKIDSSGINGAGCTQNNQRRSAQNQRSPSGVGAAAHFVGPTNVCPGWHGMVMTGEEADNALFV